MTMDCEETGRSADRPGTVDQAEFTLEDARAAVRAAIEKAVTLGALDNDTATLLIAEAEEPADVYALHEWVRAGSPKVSIHICNYPGCFHPRRQAEGPGKPPAYCT